MAESQFPAPGIPLPAPGIPLGPGGRIADPQLVEVLKRLPILQPRDLIKLAIYFNAFSTNAHLGNFLWLKALETIVTNPIVAPVIKEVFRVDIVSAEEINEDAPHGEDSDESTEDPQWVHALVGDIGLLLQKVRLENEEIAFFVVGASPDPNELPEPQSPENPEEPE